MRALSVLAVIIYHLNNRWLPGGYLGVDVFFVVSGYLMTAISIAEIESGAFSVGRFYERRVRRILPAMLVLCTVVSAVSIWLLLPTDLVGYAKSLLSALAFVANIYFWKDTDYFAPIALTKPLLHLWSLGIEEQFYLFFPTIAPLARRLRRANLIILVAFLSMLSLSLAAFTGNVGQRAFFLLPMRAWEFGGGILVALIRQPEWKPRMMMALSALAGLSLIALSLATDSIAGAVPDALPAVIGAMLLLLCSDREAAPTVERLLACRPLAFIGVISYSLYLWHWPLVVFAHYYLVRELRLSDALIIVPAALACAGLSWRYVEQPFRRRLLSLRRVAGVVVGANVCLALVALGLIHARGLPRRLPSKVAAINAAVGTTYHCPVSDYVMLDRARACALNLPGGRVGDAEIVLFGNSHAQMYAPVWREILRARHLQGITIPRPCLPMLAVNTAGCFAPTRRDLEAIAHLPKARVVIVGLMWVGPGDLESPQGRRLDNRGDAAVISGLDDVVDRLRDQGKQVILLGPIPKPGWEVASDVSRALRFGRDISRPVFEVRAQFEQAHRAALAHFSRRGDVILVQPHSSLCGPKRCDFLQDGRSLYADTNHIAAAELWRFEASFGAALDRALSQARCNFPAMQRPSSCAGLPSQSSVEPGHASQPTSAGKVGLGTIDNPTDTKHLFPSSSRQSLPSK